MTHNIKNIYYLVLDRKGFLVTVLEDIWESRNMRTG